MEQTRPLQAERESGAFGESPFVSRYIGDAESTSSVRWLERVE